MTIRANTKPTKKELPVQGYEIPAGRSMPRRAERDGYWQLRANDSRSDVRADIDGPTSEDWKHGALNGDETPEENQNRQRQKKALKHSIQEGSAWGVPKTIHAAAQRLLWEALAAGDARITQLALEAGADPHEPSWSRIDSGPTDWDSPLAWMFSNSPLHCNRAVAYRRDLFDMLWTAGGQMDPRPDDCCSGLASAWVLRAKEMDVSEVEHVGMALLRAKIDGKPGGQDGFGLLTKRSENGYTVIDQAIIDGCLPVLEFLDRTCQKLGKQVSDLMNKSSSFHVQTPSVMAVHYGLLRTKFEARRKNITEEKMTEAETEIQKEKANESERLEKITKKFNTLAIESCTWDMWRSILPDQSIPLTCIMETMGGAGLKKVRTCAGFNWNDHILMSDECALAVTKWRRTILKIDAKRRLGLGMSKQQWQSTDGQQGLNAGLLRNHPVLHLFTPILDRTILQVVQNFALNNHPLALSKNPHDRARIEKARMTIFERTVKGPKNRAPGRGPRRV